MMLLIEKAAGSKDPALQRSCGGFWHASEPQGRPQLNLPWIEPLHVPRPEIIGVPHAWHQAQRRIGLVDYRLFVRDGMSAP
jgi:hypothetical protein